MCPEGWRLQCPEGCRRQPVPLQSLGKDIVRLCGAAEHAACCQAVECEGSLEESLSPHKRCDLLGQRVL
jgi:hypothetical protein